MRTNNLSMTTVTGLAVFIGCGWTQLVLGDAPNYTVTDLGDLGGVYTEAFALNDRSEVVGYAKNASGYPRAFMWLPEAWYGMGQGMNELESLPYGVTSKARDINNLGNVAGYSQSSVGPIHATLWLPLGGYGMDRGVNDLGTLPGHNESSAYGMNNLADVVGDSWIVGQETYDPFVWLPEARYAKSPGMHELPKRLGDSRASAGDINEDGIAVGSSNEAW